MAILAALTLESFYGVYPHSMLSFFLRLLISAVALLFIAGASGGQIQVGNFTDALIAALVLGVANAVVKPILQFIAAALTLPLSCLTLGLWSLLLSWLLSATLFYAVGSALEGFEVRSFGAAMFGALALAVINAIATGLLKEKEGVRR